MTSSSPLHPAIVHLPLGIAMALVILGIVAYFLIKQNRIGSSSWILLLLLQLLVVVGTFGSMNTGEAEEEKVEKIVPESALEAHEDMSKIFAAIATATLIVSAAATRSWPIAGTMRIVGVVLYIVQAGVGMQVGRLGGKLIYEHGAASAYTSGKIPITEKSSESKEKHSDEKSKNEDKD